MIVRRLSFDIGTNMGWAILREDGSVSHGCLKLTPKKKDHPGARYLKFLHWLERVHKQAPGLDTVVYEDIRRHEGTTAAHVYGGLLACLLAWAARYGIPCVPVGVGSWKVSIGIKGNAPKPAVFSAITKLGHLPATQDEADAIGILLSTMESAK